jgi:hypothetical protein
MILISIGSLIYFKIQYIYEKGFINILPISIRRLLTQRSIFDILMDIWYLPTITEYIKLLFKPVILGLPPNEAPKLLEDFDPSIRKIFLTKVIYNVQF